jgi:hypothetical protein
MEIELLQSVGEGVPKDVIKELSKTNFVIPANSHLLRHQLNNWYGVLQVVFGPKSLVALEAKNWVTHVTLFEKAYGIAYASDVDFGAKLLGTIDATFYRFCDICIRAKSPEDINFSVLSMAHKRDDIISNCFVANKPVYLAIKLKQQ